MHEFPDDPNNRPSLEFVLTGRSLPGEIYIQDVHNYGPLEQRNTISQNSRRNGLTYYYNPTLVQTRYSEQLSAIQGEAAAGGGSVRDDKLKAAKLKEKFYATQALEASNIARDLIRRSKLENKKQEKQEQQVEKCEFECPICYNIIDGQTKQDDIRVCIRGHVFHSNCPEYNQSEATKICPICRSRNLFVFDPNQKGGFKSIFKHIKKQKQSRTTKNRLDNQTRKSRRH